MICLFLPSLVWYYFNTMISLIKISKINNQIVVSLPYNPDHIAKLKAIKDYRWHPAEKYWSYTEKDAREREKQLKYFGNAYKFLVRRIENSLKD